MEQLVDAVTANNADVLARMIQLAARGSLQIVELHMLAEDDQRAHIHMRVACQEPKQVWRFIQQAEKLVDTYEVRTPTVNNIFAH
ncbi:MAG: hypothetical protein ABF586_06765 [Sporolactobacillus sp.]